MSVFHNNILAGASGAGGAGDPTYVDDVFSIDVYEGSTSQVDVENGIDLSTEGGLVWLKRRSGSRDHVLFDTERGANKRLISNSSGAESTLGASGTLAFNDDGYDLPTGDGDINSNGFGDYCGWTFRKAPGFFDIVTWTGNENARTIAHNLGSVPGMIIVKSLGYDEGWKVWHRSLPNTATDFLNLNENGGKESSSTIWNNTAPTSTHFSLGSNLSVNRGGSSDYTYVAYVFAHDDQSFGTNSNEAIIKCGGYTGNGSTGQTIDLGFEPQWLLVRKDASFSSWNIFDSMRGGLVASGSASTKMTVLYANQDTQEQEETDAVYATSTGFELRAGSTNGVCNESGKAFIYIAIRRPHKPPTAGTEVFDDVAYTGNSSTQDISISPSIADSVLIKRRTAGDNWGWANRLTGSKQHLTPNSNAAEATRADADAVEFDRHSAFGLVGNSSGEVNYTGETLISYSFKRAPGFFDVATYTGNGSSGNVKNHNLGVAPDLIIVKKRSEGSNADWRVFSSSRGNTKALQLNSSAGEVTSSVYWNNTSPTATQFTLGSSSNVNANNEKHIAYLFATLDGISKVGTYSGTGSDVDVDCGFSAGARFVLIKRTDNTANWYVYDAARGIVSGNDPYLNLNASSAEVTSTDYIDPLNAGFRVTSSGGDDLNKSGGTYLFLAIA